MPYNNEASALEEAADGGAAEIPDEMIPLMEEMESVLYSISFGKQDSVGRTKYQAFSAAISN